MGWHWLCPTLVARPAGNGTALTRRKEAVAIPIAGRYEWEQAVAVAR